MEEMNGKRMGGIREYDRQPQKRKTNQLNSD